MTETLPDAVSAEHKTAGTTSIVLAFLSVYFFWGSTYTAIRVGAAQMPALRPLPSRYRAQVGLIPCSQSNHRIPR